MVTTKINIGGKTSSKIIHKSKISNQSEYDNLTLSITYTNWESCIVVIKIAKSSPQTSTHPSIALSEMLKAVLKK